MKYSLSKSEYIAIQVIILVETILQVSDINPPKLETSLKQNVHLDLCSY